MRSKVKETSHVIVKGGKVFSVFGGSACSMQEDNLEVNGINSNTSVVMTGGEVEQVFGGNEYGSLEGNTSVQILGGTVTRRIYGGCYNDVGSSWASDFSVKGYSSVTIGTGANISFEIDLDNSLCAVSRLGENSASETGVLVLNPGKALVHLRDCELALKCVYICQNYIQNHWQTKHKHN